MPDAFGNPTPREVLAAINQQQSDHLARAQASGSSGAQAGASLAAIFGGPIRTTLDTRKARQKEAIRLMRTEGISQEEADKRAKDEVGRERAEVREAREIQEANGAMEDFITSLPEEMDPAVKRAQGMLFLASRMRNLGLNSEATAIRLQGHKEMQAAILAQKELRNLEGRTRKTEVETQKLEEELPYVGMTNFNKMVTNKELIQASLEDPNSQMTPAQRASKMRAKGHLEAKILKEETIVGRTETDAAQNLGPLFKQIGDQNVLLANLDNAEDMLGGLDRFEATGYADITADLIGFGENWLGITPSRDSKEFVQRVTAKTGLPTLIAAKIRHSLTGAQMSAFEIVFLEPFLPSPGDSREVMLSKINVVRQYTNIDRDQRLLMAQSGVTGEWLKSTAAGQQTDFIENSLPVSDESRASAADVRLQELIDKRQAGE